VKSIARKGDHIALRFERGEAATLAALPGYLAAALRARAAPRMADDAATDRELRALLDAELAARRAERFSGFLHRVGGVPAAGGELLLTMEEAEQWLALLTDLRLALAARLDIRDDQWGRDLDPRRPPTKEHAIYFYLSGLQGMLLTRGFGVE
jgi:hypothetical protein